MADIQEKRRHPRIQDRLTLRSSSAETGSMEMSTTNLSLGGAHVVSSRYMPLMTRVEVTLHLPPDPGIESRPRSLKAEAVVVRVHPPAPVPGSRTFKMARPSAEEINSAAPHSQPRHLSAHSGGGDRETRGGGLILMVIIALILIGLISALLF